MVFSGFGHGKQNLQQNAKCKQVGGKPKKNKQRLLVSDFLFCSSAMQRWNLISTQPILAKPFSPGAPAEFVRFLHGGARLQQQLDHLNVAFTGRPVQRRLASG